MPGRPNSLLNAAAPSGPSSHDLERRGDAGGLAERVFPGALVARDAQVRDREADEAGLGLGAATSRALVADLAAGTGRGAGERRDRGRVVVGLDLHQDVDRLATTAIDAVGGIRIPAQPRRRAFDHCRVVAIGREHALGIARMGVADHREQRLVARRAVDHPGGVEDLVAAVLGVRLREHHQLDVGRVAASAAKACSR